MSWNSRFYRVLLLSLYWKSKFLLLWVLRLIEALRINHHLKIQCLPLREKYHLYIVSNCLDGYIQSFLTYHRFWDCFEDLECLGRTGKTKGENIRLIMERNAVDAAIYVGDTASDCAAAKKAGIPFVHAAYGFGKVESVPAILSIRELPAAADRLLGQQAKKC